jgi:vacuolar-type H+-ATPase subunit D/Vma8
LVAFFGISSNQVLTPYRVSIILSTLKQQITTAERHMMTLEEIRKALQDRRLDKVSTATGLHYNTVRDIRDNSEANPTYFTLKSLSDYLKD